MRKYFILLVLCFTTLIGFGQKLKLEKASPFTAVKWENNQPIVQYANEWYDLEKLDKYTTEELLNFCKEKFDAKWKKRFSEDLVEVLTEMGSPPNEKVKLILSSGNEQKNVAGTYTLKNRQKVLAYNNERENKLNRIETITIAQTIEDIEAFQHILEVHSSYLHLTDYDYKSIINQLRSAVVKSTNDIDVNYLTHELAKIMAEIGDRHSSVKNEAFVTEEHSTHQLQLPFSIAALNGKAIALKKMINEGEYEYYNADFPFVKSVNHMLIDVMIDSLVYKSKKAPKEAKFSRGVSEIQQLGKLYFINNIKLPKQIEVVFTNGKTDKVEVFQLENERHGYSSQLERSIDLKSRAIKKGDFKSISQLLKDNIGYISLPEMYGFDEIDGFEQFIDSTYTAFNHTKALIIDLRFNPGGRRDLIQKFASYLIPKANSPWVANVAYLRTDEKDVIHNSMSSRYLFPYNSNEFNVLDRKAIDEFSKKFTMQREFDTSKFSNPHYMILESGKTHYTKPVYILVNEYSFSAATVFTSAFKGLPNVTIVGVTTDGSSGNARKMYLTNSNIRVRVSTMLSFQRNGKTLDGNGTIPDRYIPADENQVSNEMDMQLEYLIEWIM